METVTTTTNKENLSTENRCSSHSIELHNCFRLCLQRACVSIVARWPIRHSQTESVINSSHRRGLHKVFKKRIVNGPDRSQLSCAKLCGNSINWTGDPNVCKFVDAAHSRSYATAFHTFLVYHRPNDISWKSANKKARDNDIGSALISSEWKFICTVWTIRWKSKSSPTKKSEWVEWRKTKTKNCLDSNEKSIENYSLNEKKKAKNKEKKRKKYSPKTPPQTQRTAQLGSTQRIHSREMYTVRCYYTVYCVVSIHLSLSYSVIRWLCVIALLWCLLIYQTNVLFCWKIKRN